MSHEVEDAAKVPGLTVEGQYTDSLGRTGTVLHAVTTLPKAEAAALAQANSGAKTSKVSVAPAPTPTL